ncbi:MAG: hypothetical protein R5N60_02600 [Cutibacterium granulosum]|nr:hypothetical protein [Cutibacterium granulosum]
MGQGISSAARTGQSQQLVPIGEGKSRGAVIRLGGREGTGLEDDTPSTLRDEPML